MMATAVTTGMSGPNTTHFNLGKRPSSAGRSGAKPKSTSADERMFVEGSVSEPRVIEFASNVPHNRLDSRGRGFIAPSVVDARLRGRLRRVLRPAPSQRSDATRAKRLRLYD